MIDTNDIPPPPPLDEEIVLDEGDTSPQLTGEVVIPEEPEQPPEESGEE